jgi:hypothetical protein
MAAQAPPRFIMPNDEQRLTIIGMTGSGKTQAAAWHLSRRSYTRRPWIVFDFKHEKLFQEIPKLEEIGITDKIPRHPGLYVVRPDPTEKEEVETFLTAIWRKERVGVYVDEGYMIHKNSVGLERLLTQGRSKQCPIIMLTQRPVGVSRFAFSEADFIQCFQLTDNRDKKTVNEYASYLPLDTDLPERFWSWWGDSVQRKPIMLQPVPDRDTILETFHHRLVQPRRVI